MHATQASSSSSERHDGVIHVLPETDDIVAISLTGDFDLNNVRALSEEIDSAQESGKSLILDLSEATFIDSSVVHVLLRAWKGANEKECAVVLQLGTAALVERVLEITRIEEVLPRAHERQEAVRMIHEQVKVVSRSGSAGSPDLAHARSIGSLRR